MKSVIALASNIYDFSGRRSVNQSDIFKLKSKWRWLVTFYALNIGGIKTSQKTADPEKSAVYVLDALAETAGLLN